MEEDSSDSVTPVQPTKKGPHGKVVSSVAWLVSETIVARALAFVSQLVLAYLLVREDFGLFAMTNMVRAIADLIATPGFRTLIIQRHADYEKLATPVFWLSFVLGLIGGGLVVILSFFAMQGEDGPTVAKMMLVIALSIPLRAMCVLPESALRIRMQFAEIAMLGAFNVGLTAILSILFAYLGFGALSLAIPFPIVGALQFLIAWYLTRPKISLKVNLSDCYSILHDSTVLFTSRVLSVVSANIDYFFLLLFHNKDVVGIYYLAFNISTQTLRLFSENLVQVLMPSLAHIPEPERQFSMTLRATRAISLIVMPSCFLLACLSPQFIELFYRPEYLGMIPILQILSVGMAFRCVGAVSNALLNAQGRFGIVLAFDIITTIIFAASVGVAAWLGDSTQVAIVVSLNVVVRMLFLQQASLQGSNITWWTSINAYLLPAILATIASVITEVATHGMSGGTRYELGVVLVAKSATFALAYLVMAMLFMREDMFLLASRIASLWPKIVIGQKKITDKGSART